MNIEHVQAKTIKHRKNRRVHPYRRRNFTSGRNETKNVKTVSESTIFNLHEKELRFSSMTDQQINLKLAEESTIDGNILIE